jgi:hypothetical protein
MYSMTNDKTAEDLIWFAEAVGMNEFQSPFVLGEGGPLNLHKKCVNQSAVLVSHTMMFQLG